MPKTPSQRCRAAPRRCSAPGCLNASTAGVPRAGRPGRIPPTSAGRQSPRPARSPAPHAARGHALERRGLLGQLQPGVGGAPTIASASGCCDWRSTAPATPAGRPGPPRSRRRRSPPDGRSSACRSCRRRARDPAEVLQVDAALHQHAMSSRLRDAGQHRRRRAQRQRARRGRHQQRHAAIEAHRPVPDAEQRWHRDEQHVATSTTGTNTRSNAAVSCSVRAFCACASATRRITRSSVRSPAARVASLPPARPRR